MNWLQQWKAKRIGPDLIATSWLLHFGFGQKIIKKKLARCGKNVWLRPGCLLVDMDSIEIGDNVTIRPGTEIYANTQNKARIIIENNVLIGSRVTMTVNNHHYSNPDIHIMFQGGSSASIIIKEGAWIGANATILYKTKTIGKNSVVAAGAVVTKEVPDYCLVAGVPARIITRTRVDNSNQVQKQPGRAD
jgi:acetyltransferase-like isoleucine patch superfamily enzyme